MAGIAEKMIRRGLVAGVVVLGYALAAPAAPLDEMALDRWAKLREVERFQLNLAERYYREQQWKAALGEYEKYVQLYEQSTAAPYAQMKWALCQVQLRNLNTAVKDGFKTVQDYWPDSPEAIASAYYLARTLRDMGDVKEAKKAYAKLIQEHGKHLAAVLARSDLLELAARDKDIDRQVALWRELTYDIERTRDTGPTCAAAARQLAWHSFRQLGSFAEGLKALATNYKEDQLVRLLLHYDHGRLPQILTELADHKDEAERSKALKLADDAVAWLKSKVPASASDDAAKAQARQLLFLAADVEAAARRPDRQREIYELVTKNYGADDELLGRLAAYHLAGKRPDEARRLYARFQNAVEGGRLTALSFRAERQYDQAIEVYRKLAAADPAKTGAWLNEAAATYREAGKADPAIGIYREIINVDPGQAGACQWNIAMTLYQFGRWKDAITAFRATDRFPDANQYMAQAHRQLMQYGEAITLYRQIVATHPSWAPWALLEIARTQEQAGQKDQAIRSFKAVCDRFPKSSEASTAHAVLQDKYKINVTLGGAKDE